MIEINGAEINVSVKHANNYRESKQISATEPPYLGTLLVTWIWNIRLFVCRRQQTSRWQLDMPTPTKALRNPCL